MPCETQLTIEQFRDHLRRLQMPRRIEETILRHTWRPQAKEYAGIEIVCGLRRDDMNVRGWSDNGSHVMVGPDGAIFLCRPLERAGAGVPGRNAHTIIVTLLGNFDAENPDDYPAMMESAALVCAALIEHFGLAERHVRFEREFVPKTSPGLKIGLTTFRARVAEIVGGDREVAEEPAAMDSSARDVGASPAMPSAPMPTTTIIWALCSSSMAPCPRARRCASDHRHTLVFTQALIATTCATAAAASFSFR